MNNKEKILKLLHRILRNDIISNEIARTTGNYIDNIEFEINDVQNQFFLDTATWGLDIFEKELDIDTISSKNYSDRRSVISAKWRGAGKLTLELIKQTADAFVNGDIDVTFTGIINIDFTSNVGKPPNIEDVYKAIEDIKPAHLGVKYIFRFRTNSEVCKYIHWELNACSHNDIRNLADYNIRNLIVDKYYQDVISGGYTCDSNNPDRVLVREEFLNSVLQKLTENGYDSNGNVAK